jgi:hypothetical protein
MNMANISKALKKDLDTPNVVSTIEVCDMCEIAVPSNKVVDGPYGIICKECVDHCLDITLEYHNIPTGT